MTRFLPRLILTVAVLTGPAALSATARATPACQARATCPGDDLDSLSQQVRPSRVVRPIRRPQIPEGRILEPISSVPEASRYVSLIILGIGY